MSGRLRLSLPGNWQWWPRYDRQRTLVDLFIPVEAVLVLCFSLGSILSHNGGLHLSAPPPPHVMKAYRKDGSMAAH
jgi:hypothetical protein